LSRTIKKPEECGLSPDNECEAIFWYPNSKWWCPYLDTPCFIDNSSEETNNV